MEFKSAFIIFILLSSSMVLSAQFDISNFHLKPFIGGSTTYPFGSSIKDLRSIETEWENTSTEESKFTGTLIPLFGITGGIEISYSILDNMEIGLGLQWSKFGHKYREVYSLKDERFQYDAELKVTNKYQFIVTQMPITATWHFSEDWHLVFGGSVGWIKSGKSARHLSKREFNVTINGEQDADESEPLKKEEFNLNLLLKKNIAGIFIGVRFPLPKSLKGYFDIHTTNNAFVNENTSINYLSTRLGIIYPINF